MPSVGPMHARWTPGLCACCQTGLDVAPNISWFLDTCLYNAGWSDTAVPWSIRESARPTTTVKKGDKDDPYIPYTLETLPGERRVLGPHEQRHSPGAV